MSEPIRLLADPGNPDGAAETFDTVQQQIGAAEESIEIFMYVWRNDEIGNRLGQPWGGCDHAVFPGSEYR